MNIDEIVNKDSLIMCIDLTNKTINNKIKNFLFYECGIKYFLLGSRHENIALFNKIIEYEKDEVLK